MSFKPLSVFLLFLFLVGLFSVSDITSTGGCAVSSRRSIASTFDYENVTTHEGDLIINGTQTFVIENCTFSLTGNIFVSENATLVITNSLLAMIDEYGGQLDLLLNGFAVLDMANSRLESRFGVCIGNLGHARTTMNHSSAEGVTCFDKSSLTIENSTVEDLLVASASKITVIGSILNLVSLGLGDQNLDLHDLRPGSYDFWNLRINQQSPDANQDLTLIDTRVNRWRLFLDNRARIVVKSSTLAGIAIHYNKASEIRDEKGGYYDYWSSEALTLENCSVGGWGAFFYEPPCIIFNSTISFAVWARGNVSVVQSKVGVDFTGGSGVLSCNNTVINYVRFVNSTPFIYGDVQFTASSSVDVWVSSNVTRNYEMVVTDPALNPIENASLFFLNQDDTFVEELHTDANGEVAFNTTFVDTNFTASFKLRISKDGFYNFTQWNSFFSDTPITIRLAEKPASDLNEDGVINIVDVALVATSFECVPTDEGWNELCDLNKDGTINIVDVTMVARDYGKTI